jgi:hypothetical protein
MHFLNYFVNDDPCALAVVEARGVKGTRCPSDKSAPMGRLLWARWLVLALAMALSMENLFRSVRGTTIVPRPHGGLAGGAGRSFGPVVLPPVVAKDGEDI